MAFIPHIKGDDDEEKIIKTRNESRDNAHQAVCSYQDKEYKKAISLFTKVKKSELDWSHYFKWADCYSALTKETLALKIYHQGIEHYPDDVHLATRFSKFLISIGKHKDALILLNTVEKNLPLKIENDKYHNGNSFNSIHYNKANCFIGMKQPLLALNEFALLTSSGDDDYTTWIKEQTKKLGLS